MLDRPDPPQPLPAALRPLLATGDVELVWCNEAGGLTYEVTGAAGRRFVKWAPAGSGLPLAGEEQRLRWAVQHVVVPRVLARGGDLTGEWLVTAALPGSSAVAPRWLAEPATAVSAIGSGLRAFHDALPVASCPFAWSVRQRLDDVERRAARGLLDPHRWHREHSGLAVGHALDVLREPPPVDGPVVCQGDACAPNTLVGEDGRASGHVDLGALGVADRWADLAIATWSAEWNYGPGWDRHLLDAYGADPDPDRTRYYRLLWDLGP